MVAGEQKTLPFYWVIALALPSLYLLSGSSLQFGEFALVPVTNGGWYISLALTGAVLSIWAPDLKAAALGTLWITGIQVIGHAAAFFVSMWILSGYEVAKLSMNFMYQPTVLYSLVSVVLLTSGVMIGALLSSFAFR